MAMGLGVIEIVIILVVLGVMAAAVIAIVVAIVASNRKKPRVTPPLPTPPPPLSATIRLCPKCGKALEADAPQGLCPSCLMRAAFTTAPGSSAGKADTVPPLPADLAAHFPQLEILELLGQGGMGMVYKARQSQLDRFVALKLLPIRDSHDPAFAERFSREARALAKLNHPNIVSVHDFGQTEKYCWFIMEYVDGVNLRQMEQTQRLTPEQAIAIIPKICDALQYAHDEGVVHRDIKPGNILIDKKSRVKIADFGLAKLLGKKDGDAHLTQSNVVMGTPHYMAPEQMNSPLSVDHRADIYSLGVVFYEMLTGELPIGRFAPPSQKVQMDVRLDEVVLRTLESEPARRYQQVSEVRSDVESISGVIEKLPPAMRYAMGGEYRSQTTIGGLPLVHIAWGTDLHTGKKREARGIIAIGDSAYGAFAFGGFARGGFAFGGIAIGVVAVGGVGIGLISFAGLAMALLFAYGGFSVAGIAVGGCALGYYSNGGAAFGVHPMGANLRTREAVEFFRGWLGPWLNWVMLALVVPSFVVPIVANLFTRGRLMAELSGASGPRKTKEIPADPLRELYAPSFALTIVAVLEWISLVVASIPLLYMGAREGGQTPSESLLGLTGPWLAVSALFLLMMSAVMIWGAFRMRQGKSYGLACTACILAMLMTPANLIGLPVGIWALVVLLRPEVKAAFR